MAEPAPHIEDGNGEPVFNTRRRIGLVLGATVFVGMLLSAPPDGLSQAGWYTAATALLIAIWWVTEAIPLSATGLVPLVAFPILGVTSIKATAQPYAHPIIFLLLGGFIIALAMQRWNLHRRIALTIISKVGSRPPNVIGGFMLACAFISMWVFNTTTTIMMLPIAVSVIELMRDKVGDDPAHAQSLRNFATAMMVGVAYAATIGGMGTLIGTAPNLVLAAFMSETYGVEVSFAQWMMIGVPMIAIMLPAAWFVLVKVVFPIDLPAMPGEEDLIKDQLRAMGPMSRGERTVLTVVAVAVFLWLFKDFVEQIIPWISLNDTSIGVLAAVSLFVIPVNLRKGVFALSGEWALKLPWGVVVMFGGGLSLASTIKSSGLSDWIGAGASLMTVLPTVAVVLIVVILIIFLTELTSNTATTATFLPIVAAVAVGMGENPLLLVFPTVLAASCAFMMPVATPPNAVVFASGHITVAQMVRGGFLVNLIGIVVATVMAYTLVLLVFGIEPGVLPEWAQSG